MGPGGRFSTHTCNPLPTFHDRPPLPARKLRRVNKAGRPRFCLGSPLSPSLGAWAWPRRVRRVVDDDLGHLRPAGLSRSAVLQFSTAHRSLRETRRRIISVTRRPFGDGPLWQSRPPSARRPLASVSSVDPSNLSQCHRRPCSAPPHVSVALRHRHPPPPKPPGVCTCPSPNASTPRSRV